MPSASARYRFSRNLPIARSFRIWMDSPSRSRLFPHRRVEINSRGWVNRKSIGRRGCGYPMTGLSFAAEQVRLYDHDRYLTAIFAPPRTRNHAFALYAFNVEIAKTREVVTERL